jgi:Type I phosphodiesterase / nucleotide pyrophosphatase
MAQSPVILLEFNELCPQLMNRFLAEGQLPNFQKLYERSEVYLTDAEEKAPNLEPWIQWVTVHSGMPYSTHKIFDLGDGHLLKQQCIWDLLSRANRKVWICGSMNARYDMPLNGYLLPDPWSSGTPPHPDTLLPYLNFVRANVHEHTNAHAAFRKSDAAKFLTFMATHGLSMGTVSTILRQLASEQGARNRWKRSTILDQLQFDVFRHFYRKFRPDFSTFFLNSTAHLQHMYWRNMEPSLFKIQPSEQEQAEFAAAILYGYRQMDELVGEFLRVAGKDATLIFCTALSQQPCLIYDDAGGKILYRPREFGRLMSFAGLKPGWTVAPVMAEQFHLYFENEEDAAEGERRLNGLKVGEMPALYVKRQESSLFCGCPVNRSLAESATLAGEEGKTVPFFDVFYQIEGIKSGMHQSDGMLWISTPARSHAVHEEKVPLTAIAPTILEMFDIPVPAYMEGGSLAEMAGRSRARAAAV